MKGVSIINARLLGVLVLALCTSPAYAQVNQQGVEPKLLPDEVAPPPDSEEEDLLDDTVSPPPSETIEQELEGLLREVGAEPLSDDPGDAVDQGDVIFPDIVTVGASETPQTETETETETDTETVTEIVTETRSVTEDRGSDEAANSDYPFLAIENERLHDEVESLVDQARVERKNSGIQSMLVGAGLFFAGLVLGVMFGSRRRSSPYAQ